MGYLLRSVLYIFLYRNEWWFSCVECMKKYKVRDIDILGNLKGREEMSGKPKILQRERENDAPDEM